VIGIVLTGTLEDGIAGLWEIKRRGGVAVVQDPVEATFGGMPEAALESVKVDYCLPLDRIAAKLVTLANRRPSPPPVSGSRTARIMIVEDERIVALNLERRLEELGYQVCASVGSGEEALTTAATAHPDLVLMDIRLPGALDGTAAARNLWDRFELPVVYLTAYADDETLDKVKSTHSYGYVMKPFNPVEVHAVMQVALARRDRELYELLPPRKT
jgi:chemotaxis response regulator CheB